MVEGYYLNFAYRSADFRSLYTLTYNLNVKAGKQRQPEQLWRLPIDGTGKEYTHEELVARNQMIKRLMK